MSSGPRRASGRQSNQRARRGVDDRQAFPAPINQVFASARRVRMQTRGDKIAGPKTAPGDVSMRHPFPHKGTRGRRAELTRCVPSTCMSFVANRPCVHCVVAWPHVCRHAHALLRASLPLEGGLLVTSKRSLSASVCRLYAERLLVTPRYSSLSNRSSNLRGRCR
jgi:hypothetical protein